MAHIFDNQFSHGVRRRVFSILLLLRQQFDYSAIAKESHEFYTSLFSRWIFSRETVIYGHIDQSVSCSFTLLLDTVCSPDITMIDMVFTLSLLLSIPLFTTVF